MHDILFRSKISGLKQKIGPEQNSMSLVSQIPNISMNKRMANFNIGPYGNPHPKKIINILNNVFCRLAKTKNRPRAKFS